MNSPIAVSIVCIWLSTALAARATPDEINRLARMPITNASATRSRVAVTPNWKVEPI